MMSALVTVSKKFDFDAAHKLPNVPPGHKCGQLHGHTYVVELILRGRIDVHDGWFIDYAEIAKAWEPLHKVLDHKYLNDIDGLANPTTEVLVGWVAKRLYQPLAPLRAFLDTVRIYESSTTWCEIAREDFRDV